LLTFLARVDVLTYRAAYFGTAGIEVGGSVGAGWASSTFNDAYVGIDKSALNRMSVEGWLTAYVNAHVYIGPHFEFSTTVDPGVRAELARPTFFFVGLTTGAEF
jgi:outer membrane scaffolding protein for murein synthesis (MipA/OmpV family)